MAGFTLGHRHSSISKMVAPNIQTLTSKDGTLIYAESAGDPSKPHVLLAHAMACDCTGFDSLFLDESLQAQLYMVRRLHEDCSRTLILCTLIGTI